MNKRMYLKLAAAALATWLASGLAFAQTTIDVQYPLGFIFDKTMQEVKTEFEKRNPSVRVNFRPAYKEYEDAAQTALRDSITKNLPDVSFQAINLQRLFVDRKIAVDLTPFIGRRKELGGRGFLRFHDGALKVRRQRAWARLRGVDTDCLL